MTIERRPYRTGDANGFRLVITATDDCAVNGAVFADAEAAGVWVNSADASSTAPSSCPRSTATVRDGRGVTAGQSPAFAAWFAIGYATHCRSAWQTWRRRSQKNAVPCTKRGEYHRGARLACAHRRARR